MNESKVKIVVDEMIKVLENVEERDDVGNNSSFFFGGSRAALEMLVEILDGEATIADFAESCEKIYNLDHILRTLEKCFGE